MSGETYNFPNTYDGNESIALAEDVKPFFSPEESSQRVTEVSCWKILLVDDDPGVHQVTQLALRDFSFEGKFLQVLSAYSEADAQEKIFNNPDIAIIFLDVVMERENSGLNVVKYIRDELRNTKVRIILRTGQSGKFSEETVSLQYDINDYQVKTELTRNKLLAKVITNLRGFSALVTIEENQLQLEEIISENTKLYEQLEEYTYTLRDKVAERTQELEKKNRQLEREIQERRRVEQELQAANKKLAQLASLDGLTQIANRRRFDEYLQQQWYSLAQENKPCSLIFYDVDYFKLYNDTYGHQAGDRCLKIIARVLTAVVKRSQDLVARYGGEEFAVILPNTIMSQAQQVALEIQLALAQRQLPHFQSLVSQYVTASMGISTQIPTLQSSPHGLIHAADIALYKAKRQGRNCICH